MKIHPIVFVAAAIVASLLVPTRENSGNTTPATSGSATSVWAHQKVGEGVVHHSQATGQTQKILYGASLDPEDPRWLRIRNYPTIVAAQPDEEFLFSASYEIVYVASKGKDHYFVLGRTSSGEAVIERWKRKNKVQQVGQPSYLMTRTELYHGTSLGDVRSIGADGQGRYLLIAHGDPPVVSQMTLPSGAITQVYDSAQIPDLVHWTMGIFPKLHATQGMVWTMTLGDEFLVMEDLDNDAAIDLWVVLDQTTYYNEFGFNGPILDDFTYNQ